MSRPASRVCRVVVTGPLAPFADAYRAELRRRGYTALTTVNELRQVARLSRWLEASGLTAGDLSVGRVEQFLDVQRSEGRRLRARGWRCCTYSIYWSASAS
jgi:integrase/recombinase XerD